ncbi:MAG: hypothetical protein BAA04_02170 [Firmicutes bacterium ZCTH02-B6]|nr:MAG: hypothetical protein BAA04_02170 [Firmicutes bacterium ZCTH02-B6]
MTIVASVASLLLFGFLRLPPDTFLLPAAGVGTARAQADGEVAPLYLSQAVATARLCGPGFAGAHAQAEALRLERLVREAEMAPRPRIGATAELYPLAQARPVLELEWDVLEYVSVSADLPNSVTVGYTRPVWPPDALSLRRAVGELDAAVRGLEYQQALVNSHRAVVEAFHALSVARAEAELAREVLKLAQSGRAPRVSGMPAGRWACASGRRRSRPSGKRK